MNRTTELLDLSSYYLFDIWRKYGDPKIMDLPLMAYGPWYFYSIALTFVFFIKVIGPSYMADKKPFYLKPYLMVFNGLLFGGYGGFFVGGSVFTRFGAEGFNCEAADPNSQELFDVVIRLLGYVFLIGKCGDFVVPVFQVLLKKSVSDLHLMHTLFMVFITYLGLIYYPGGVFLFFPYMDGLYYCLFHCYLTMVTPPGSEYKPKISWAPFLIQLRMGMFAMVLLHGIYFATQSNCGPPGMKAIQISYAVLALVLLLKDYKRTVISIDLRKRSTKLSLEQSPLTTPS